MPCVCVTGPQKEALLGSSGTGWASPEELSDQASQAQHFERLAQLCIMSKRYVELTRITQMSSLAIRAVLFSIVGLPLIK